MSKHISDPKEMDDRELRTRVDTYKRMDTSILVPADRRFIERRLMALLEEVLKREEQRDADT